MSGPEIPEGAVKLHEIGEAYADIASVEETLSRMALSPVLIPTVNLPLKPPPARSRYMAGAVGQAVGAVALNFSNMCLFNREDLSRVIVKITGLTVRNNTAGALSYHIRRNDQPVQSGHTFSAWIPAYSDAGSSSGFALGMNISNNNTVAPGVSMLSFGLDANTTVTFPFKAVVNNGQFCLTSNLVNQAVEGIWWFRVFPIVHEQLPG